MLVILSPAKTLDFDSPTGPVTPTQPEFLDDAQQLITRLRRLSPADVATLMSLSQSLVELNRARYSSWQPVHDESNARPAILAFKGDVYMGLEPWTLSAKDLGWAQEHVRILSGLYGLLRPLDLIQPYRLEMGSALATRRGSDLYAFWSSKLARAVNAALAAQGDDVLVNLASNEYYRALDPDEIAGRIVTPTFKERRDGKIKFVSFSAKKARGLMTRYIVQKRLKSVAALKRFDASGYRYADELSSADEWVFLRG